MVRFGAVGEFLRLLLQQKASAFVLELTLNLRTNFFKRGRSRRLYAEQLEHHITLWDLHNIRRSLVRFAEHGFRKLRIRGHSGQSIGPAEEVSGYRSLTFCRSRLVESVSTRLAKESIRRRFGGARRFLLLHFLFNLALHLGEGLEMGCLFVFDADDVEAVTALDEVAGLSFAERKRSLFELRNGAAAADPAEFAPTLGAPGIVRIFFRKLGEISPALDLLQDVFSFRARIGARFLIYFGARRRKRNLDQDVGDLHLFGHAILVAMLIVVGLQILIGNRGRSRHFRAIRNDILDLPLFRDGIVVLRLVAFVVSLQFFIGGVQAL